MSGHSKWSSIKHAKGAADQKRGAIFSKLAKAITVATKDGGGDENANFKLRLVVSKAKQANMPKDNIKRAIESGLGGAEGNDYKEDIYEAYGPGGSALIIETLTNNVNRTISEIKHTLSKYNGKLAERNSAMRLFENAGVITLTKDTVDEFIKNDMELLLIDLGAIDIENENGGLIATFKTNLFNTAATALTKKGVPAQTESITRPLTPLTLSGKELEQLQKLYEKIDELDDVETIFTNVENL